MSDLDNRNIYEQAKWEREIQFSRAEYHLNEKLASSHIHTFFE